VLHLLLLLILASHFKQGETAQDTVKLVEIELEQDEASPKNQNHTAKDTSPERIHQKTESKKYEIQKKRGRLKLKDLMPSNSYAPDDIFKNDKQAQAKKIEWVVEDLSFYKELWKALNAKFYYPDIFNTLFITGLVTTDIYVRPDGSLSRYILSVEGANEDVELFIKALIVEALYKPLHPKFWLRKQFGPRDEVKLRLNFDLDMLLLPEGLDNYSQGHVNRRELFFIRKVFNPKANAVAKALPFLSGPGMVDVVYIFNAVSGRLKQIYERNMKKLKRFKESNRRSYSKKRH